MGRLWLYAGLAAGGLRRQWAGALALAAAAAVASAALAAAPAFGGALGDLALREALRAADPADLEVRAARDPLPLDREAYREAQAATDDAVHAALGGAGGAQARSGATGPLDLLAALPGPDADEPPPRLGAAALRFRSDLEDRVVLDAGAFPPPQPRALGDPLPVLAGAETAEALGLAPGAILALRPPGAFAAPPVAVEVAGVARPLDAGDAGWLGGDGEAFALLVPEASFFGAAADLLPGAGATFESSYAVEPSAVRASGVAGLAARVRALVRGEAAAPSGLRFESGLPRALAGAGATPGLDRAALTLLLGQAAAAGGLLVAALAARLARGRRDRHEALALRGASPPQLAAIEAFAALPTALAAFALGPPLAAAAVAALGRLGAFEAYSGGGWLRFDPGADAPAYAAIAGLAAFALAWAPAALAARRAAAPSAPRGASGPSPLAAGAALAIAAAVGAWALTRGERLFAADGEARLALLLAPAALLLPAALAGAWALPRLAEPPARLAALGRSAAALAALRGLARRPGGLAFALAGAAMAVAALYAALPDALDRSPGERAAHAAGADLRASGLRALDGRGEAAFRAAVAEVPADAASPVARAAVSLRGEDGEAVAIGLLGVDPATFGGVAVWREDYAPQSLDAILETLAANAAAPGGVALPGGTRRVGAWVRLPELAGEASLAVALRDAEGRSHDLLLGRLRPGALAGWGFLAADLATPLGLGGEPLDAAALAGALTVEALYARLGPEASGAAGRIVFGPLLASRDAPSAPLDDAARLLPRSAGFARRAIVHDLADLDGIEPIADLAAGGGAGQSVRETIDAPPGFEGSLRLDWTAAAAGAEPPPLRGFRRETDGAPVLLHVSREALARLGAAPGDELALDVAGRRLRAQAAGTLDRFPALGADGGAFAVAHLGRLLDAANASPGGERLRSSEAWFASSDPAATARARSPRRWAAAPPARRRAPSPRRSRASPQARRWASPPEPRSRAGCSARSRRGRTARRSRRRRAPRPPRTRRCCSRSARCWRRSPSPPPSRHGGGTARRRRCTRWRGRPEVATAAAPTRRTPIAECDALYLERPGGEAGFALSGLTLRVEAGAFTPLLGPAGAGKTALLRVLAGRARPLAGRAVVAGVDLAAAGADEAREHAAEAVGFAPSPAGAGLLPELGLANAGLALRLAGRGRDRARRRARELAEALGLAPGAPAGRLPPAAAARLAIAAAFAHAPPLLLLDEPTAGLAPADRDDLIEALRRLGEAEGAAILLATRDPALAHRVGGVVRLGGGRVRGELVRLVAFSRGEGERTEELAIVDGDGRVEIPPADRAALGIGGRARVTLEDGHVGVWPERPPPDTEPPWRRR